MIYSVDIYNEQWKKLKAKELNDKIFNDENINQWLIHEFILMQLANARNPIAHTKTRWEINFSWRKLFKQKWTWRARVWDAASPIRRHWWTAFWPRNIINHTKSMPKKMRLKALFWALTMKVKDEEILCLNKYSSKQIKTKEAYDMLKNLWLDNQKVLFVIPSKDELLIKSFRNIDNVKYLIVDYINPNDLLTHKKVLFMEESLDKLETIFLK